MEILPGNKFATLNNTNIVAQRAIIWHAAFFYKKKLSFHFGGGKKEASGCVR